MKKVQFKTDIHAPAALVYNAMLGLSDIQTYEQWTAEFNAGSTYEGSWTKGSKILFIGTGENGEKGGMVAEIAENMPGRFVSIRHYGILKGDQEITSGPEVEKWAGGLENYTFEESNGITTITIDVDITEDFADYFNATWPKALAKLKELCEQQ